MARRFLKANEVRDIYRRYCQLEDVDRIAADYKVCRETVYRIGRGFSHACVTGHKQILSDRRRLKLPENLVELYAKYSLVQLANEFECSRAMVRAELVERGARIREPYSKEAKEMMVRNRKGYMQIYETQRRSQVIVTPESGKQYSELR